MASRFRQRRRSGGNAAWLYAIGGALIVAVLAAIAGIFYVDVTDPRAPTLAKDTLCPVDGPRGTTVVLIDASDDLPDIGKREVTHLLLDIAANNAVATALVPLGPARTLLVSEYLFRQEAIAEPGFDPGDVVDFNELIASQDAAVCERVQLGVSSRAFTHGVLAEKDGLLASFNARYLAARGGDSTTRL